MAKEGLSNRRVAALVPEADEYIEWDGNLGGFGVRVSAGGTKAFVLKYKIAGRSRTMKLGTFGDITCEQARAKATKARGLIADGIDPSADRDAQRNAAALDDVWAKFVAVNTPHWSERTIGEYQRYFRDHIRPALGNRAPNTIDRSSVASIHHKLRNTPVTANRVLATLSSFIGFCSAEGIYPDKNPCKHVKRFEENPRERVLSDTEIARLGAALDGYNGNVFVKAAIRLILLIGCRKMEVLGMRWTEVNLDEGTVRLPKTKTGPRTIYLGAEAVQILRDLPRFQDNPFVLPGDKRGDHIKNINKAWGRISAAAEIKNATIHDLRRTFGSRAVSSGQDLYMVSKLLGHGTVKMTEYAYAFMNDDTKATAAREIADGMSRALAGRYDNIVPLKKAGQ